MTVGGHDNRGPSIAELQRYIRNGISLEFLLANGNTVVGRLRWFDEQAFSLEREGEEPFTILRLAVLGYRPHGTSASNNSESLARQAKTATSLPETSAVPPPSEVTPPQKPFVVGSADGGQASGDDMEAQLRGIEELEKTQRSD